MFARRVGPKEPGLREIRPTNRKFSKLVSYRTYRLEITSHRDGAWRRGRGYEPSLGRKKRNQAYMTEHLPFRFAGKDPITILEFLSLFVEYADGIGLDEEDAYQILPHAIVGKASNHLNAGKRLGRGSVRGITNWPTAVQSLLTAYATNENIKTAVSEFKSVEQGADETEDDYFDRFQAKHARAGSYLAEADQVSAYIEGLRPEIRPKVRDRFTNEPKTGLLDISQYAKAEGEACRAVKAMYAPTDLGRGGLARRGTRPGARGAMLVDESGNPTGPAVNLLGQGHPYNVDEGYTESDSDTCLHDEPYAVLAMQGGRYSRRGQPRNDDFTKADRAGWVDEKGGHVPNDGKPRRKVRETTICYRCYAVGDHYASGCAVDIQKNARIVCAQFEELSAGQKNRLPWGSYNFLKGYYTPDMRDIKGPIDNPFASTVPSPALVAKDPPGNKPEEK